MKHRRSLFALALAALGSSTSLACILSLDQAPGPLDAGGVDAGRVDADAAPPALFICSDGGLFWDGASPTTLVIHGAASPTNIHLEIVQGAGPPLSLSVYDKHPNMAALGTFPPCTSTFDDDGSLHPDWGIAPDGSLLTDYEFFYVFTILGVDGGIDRTWTYSPVIDVEALEPDGGSLDVAKTDPVVTCVDNVPASCPDAY